MDDNNFPGYNNNKKSKKKSAEILNSDEDESNKTKKHIKVKKDKNEKEENKVIDVDNSKIKISEQPDRIKISQIDLIKDESVMSNEGIVLKVLETYNQDEFFVLNRTFILIWNEFFIVKDPKSKRAYQSNGLAKFGRESNLTEYQSDFKFNKEFTEISRRQFQINMNDDQSFSLQCVSPNETCLKVVIYQF